jgi:hypothetical protein
MLQVEGNKGALHKTANTQLQQVLLVLDVWVAGALSSVPSCVRE